MLTSCWATSAAQVCSVENSSSTKNARAQAMAKLANDLSKVSGKRCSVIAAAEGVLSVANTNMERALRHISVERGHDPRQFALLPFGGAGGLHAVDLARALRIPTIIAPTAPGALSAVGVLVADVIKDQSRTVMFTYRAKADRAARKSFCAKWKGKRRRCCAREGFPRSNDSDTNVHSRCVIAGSRLSWK